MSLHAAAQPSVRRAPSIASGGPALGVKKMTLAQANADLEARLRAGNASRPVQAATVTVARRRSAGA